MKRFVLQQLIEWKNREDRKPLILNGARQVGKTWLLHEFAKLEYKKEAYVVCRKNNLARQLFSQDFNVDRILRGLRAMTSVDITPGDTLIILDEIQDIPEALESLKYFKEEVPEYHIAVAGSLLGISLHQDVSYPVGKVNVINILKSATKPFNVLLACTRPLITELSDKLRQKHPLLPTTSPYPTMRLETIRSIIPISCRRYPKSV